MPEASRGPILLLHGAGGWRDDGFAAAAGARRFTVLAPALRGFPVPSASLRRARPSAQAAIGDRPLDERILDWLRVVGEGAAAVRGVSLGAYLALHLASCAEFVPVVALAPTSEAFIRARFRSWGANVDAESFERFLAARDVHQAAARVSCPVLYVTARDDERIPAAHVERLHEVTPRSELVVRDTGSHSGPAHDAEVHELTLDWIERVLSPG